MESLALRDDTVGAAMRRLRNAQKSSKGAPLYSLYVNRPLGRVFAAVAYRLGLTPNQVTAVSAVFTCAGIVLIALAPVSWWIGIPVTAALCLGYALDSADGQLARLRGGGSTTGEWLDHVIDSAKTSALHLAVLVAFFRHYHLSDWRLLIPIGFAVVAAVHFFGMILNEQLARTRRLQAGLDATPPRRNSPRWMAVAKLPTDYGLLCCGFAMFGLPVVFQALYALLAVANGGYLLLILPKWYREMGALDHLDVGGSANER
jgi:phosphatidylglycerophosphate synthase